jgi:hypothetical protein
MIESVTKKLIWNRKGNNTAGAKLPLRPARLKGGCGVPWSEGPAIDAGHLAVRWINFSRLLSAASSSRLCITFGQYKGGCTVELQKTLDGQRQGWLSGESYERWLGGRGGERGAVEARSR